MIDTAINVIDRLISLVKYRDEYRRNLFREVVEPLFVEIQNAYLEYVRALTQIRASVESHASLPDLLKRARELRNQTAVMRHKISEVADGYVDSLKAPDIRDFVAGAPSLFSSTFDSSDFYEFVRKLEGLAWRSQFQLSSEETLDHARLSEILESMLDGADRTWRMLCGEYGRLLARYYEPTSIFGGQGKLHNRHSGSYDRGAKALQKSSGE